MSIHAIDKTWKTKPDHVTSRELLCLLALADHAHENGTNAFPTQKTLANKMNYKDPRRVREILGALEEKGLIVNHGQKGPSYSSNLKPNLYDLVYQDGSNWKIIEDRCQKYGTPLPKQPPTGGTNIPPVEGERVADLRRPQGERVADFDNQGGGFGQEGGGFGQPLMAADLRRHNPNRHDNRHNNLGSASLENEYLDNQKKESQKTIPSQGKSSREIQYHLKDYIRQSFPTGKGFARRLQPLVDRSQGDGLFEQFIFEAELPGFDRWDEAVRWLLDDDNFAAWQTPQAAEEYLQETPPAPHGAKPAKATAHPPGIQAILDKQQKAREGLGERLTPKEDHTLVKYYNPAFFEENFAHLYEEGEIEL